MHVEQQPEPSSVPQLSPLPQAQGVAYALDTLQCFSHALWLHVSLLQAQGVAYALDVPDEQSGEPAAAAAARAPPLPLSVAPHQCSVRVTYWEQVRSRCGQQAAGCFCGGSCKLCSVCMCRTGSRCKELAGASRQQLPSQVDPCPAEQTPAICCFIPVAHFFNLHNPPLPTMPHPRQTNRSSKGPRVLRPSAAIAAAACWGGAASIGCWPSHQGTSRC